MNKGKLKNKQSYSSIVFIPHSPGKVKTLEFTNLSFKLKVSLILAAVVFISLILFVTFTIYENFKLKANISQLSDLTIEQKNLLDGNASELKALKQKDEDTSKKITEFQDKLKNLTDNYLSNRTGNVQTSRSGDRTDRSFVDGVNELKGMLDELRTLDSSGKASSVSPESDSKFNAYMDSLPTMWPTVGRISSGFGGRKDPFQLGKKQHEGMDIAAPYGQNIVAAGTGSVIFSGWYGGYGYAIIIDHGHGITSLYGHTSKMLVKKGQKVSKGEVIARVGSSGRSTGSHLHFEVRINDTPVDPLKYLDDIKHLDDK